LSPAPLSKSPVPLNESPVPLTLSPVPLSLKAGMEKIVVWSKSLV
jgi:hypothetical protein